MYYKHQWSKKKQTKQSLDIAMLCRWQRARREEIEFVDQIQGNTNQHTSSSAMCALINHSIMLCMFAQVMHTSRYRLLAAAVISTGISLLAIVCQLRKSCKRIICFLDCVDTVKVSYRSAFLVFLSTSSPRLSCTRCFRGSETQ